MIYILTVLDGPLWAVQRVHNGKAETVAIYNDRHQADGMRAVLSVELSEWRRAYGKED